MTTEGPLLATKMHAPAPRDAAVRRERLIQSLTRPARLVVIAAPAGFGKTSLLTEWLASRPERRTAWMSLDARDDDPGAFWRYLLASIDAARGEPTHASALLASGAATTEAVLATLVNELHRDDREFLIVLDDLHVIADATIHAGLAYLVDHLPSGVRLVIATRADPPLPLARLRARGDLIEVRAANLRFTSAEATEYLTQTMSLAVDSRDVDALCERTEGWIAALQLAALSLQGRHDPTDFIAGFAGDDRYVVDYLVEEVLQRQADDVRAFLLQTSILGRLCSALCEAVTATGGAAPTLEALERGNLFLVPLDDRREWFRYHHLFAEMLRARLLDEQPGIVDELHLRASTWFEQQGETADAIIHAIEGHAFERAARLIKAAAPAMQRQRQELTLAGWYGMLPSELVRADPELGIGYAGVFLSAGRTDGVEQLLADAEAAVGGTSEAVLALRRGIALYGSAQAMNRGQLATALEQSAVAVALSADGSHLDRGSAHGIRGLVLWALGELEEARATWATSLDALEKADHVSDVLGGSIAMADILIALGRRDEAEQTYRRGLTLGMTATPPLRGTADMHVGLADLLGDLGDLEGARSHLGAAEALGEYAGLPQNRHRRRMALAKLRAAEGDPAEGIPLLDEAEALYTPDFFPEVRPIGALRIRLQIAARALDDARAGVRRRGVAPDDELSYLREYDHITLARLLVAEGDAATAIVLIDRLLEAAHRGGRAGVVGELDSLRSLLGGGARRTAGVGRIPLSERELEVLRLLATDLSGPEIARHLVISLNTLRTHTKSIFTKLDVTSRREAVTRAAGLGLLKSPR